MISSQSGWRGARMSRQRNHLAIYCFMIDPLTLLLLLLNGLSFWQNAAASSSHRLRADRAGRAGRGERERMRER
ncbi:hypothetical protein C1H46_015564 [Malus baccata]|uniref:Uncharacterized protein n=1 Tax=Malus baccata TaxID=106549 RepID=A0A540MJG8_MALBA|nr:hypothetical protein C1H46_015564 [Malus baccata]